jgi:hypothetical protein
MTPREAVRTFSVSRATLLKDLQNGKVSGTRDDKNNWQLDPAELARVYRYRPVENTSPDQTRPDHMGRTSPDQIYLKKPLIDAASADLNLRLVRAELELAAEREKNTLLQRHLDDVRRMLPAPDATPKRRWWPWP